MLFFYQQNPMNRVFPPPQFPGETIFRPVSSMVDMTAMNSPLMRRIERKRRDDEDKVIFRREEEEKKRYHIPGNDL